MRSDPKPSNSSWCSQRIKQPGVDEWEQTRLSLADKLHGPPRLVFLMVYGETEYTNLPKVAKCLNLSSSWVKKHHVTALGTA